MTPSYTIRTLLTIFALLAFVLDTGYQEGVSASRQKSFITNKDNPESPVAHANTPNAIVSGALQSFWLSWQEGVLSVG